MEVRGLSDRAREASAKIYRSTSRWLAAAGSAFLLGAPAPFSSTEKSRCRGAFHPKAVRSVVERPRCGVEVAGSWAGHRIPVAASSRRRILKERAGPRWEPAQLSLGHQASSGCEPLCAVTVLSSFRSVVL